MYKIIYPKKYTVSCSCCHFRFGIVSHGFVLLLQEDSDENDKNFPSEHRICMRSIAGLLLLLTLRGGQAKYIANYKSNR